MRKTNMNDVEPIPEDMHHAMITQALSVFEAPDIDLQDPNEVQTRIKEYFMRCNELGLRPGNMGLYAALGISRQDFHNAVTGKSRRKLTPESIDMIKKAQIALATYREQLGAQGKLNPVTLIFWQKNYDGLADTHQIEVDNHQTTGANLTPEEIARQIEQDIPIDVPQAAQDGSD